MPKIVKSALKKILIIDRYMVFVTLIVLVATMILWRFADTEDEKYVERVAEHQSDLLFARIENRTFNLTNALRRMAGRLNQINKKDDLKTWRPDATNYFQEFPGLTTIFITDLRLNVLDSVSTLETVNFEDHNFLYQPVFRAVFEDAAYDTKAAFSEVNWPGHVGSYISFVIPRGSFDHIEGYMVGVLDSKAWIQEMGLDKEFLVRVTSYKKVIFDTAGDRDRKVRYLPAITRELNFGNTKWTIEFKPKWKSFYANTSYLSQLILIFGLVIMGLVYSLGVFIAQSKKQNFIIQKNQARLSAVVKGIPDAIYVFSKTGMLKETLVSNNLIRFQVGAQTLSSDIDLIFRPKAGVLKSVIAEVLAGGKANTFEFTRSDEVFRYDFEGRIIKLDDTEALVIIRDISDEKQMERLAEEAKARDIQAIKMAELGEVAGGVAHEINNPLAIIQGSVELLLKQIQSKMPDPAVVEKLAGNINLTVRRISKIVQGLKIFARDGSNDPLQQINIKNLINDAVDFCNRKVVESAAEIRIIGLEDSTNANLKIEGRETELIQVISNLISNACDAVENQKQRSITIAVSLHINEVEISVTDSGHGIPKEILHRIMTPFFTTKSVGKGTGLGLSIVRGIVRSHHGKVFVDTECANTRFVLRLPITQNLKMVKSA